MKHYLEQLDFVSAELYKLQHRNESPLGDFGKCSILQAAADKNINSILPFPFFVAQKMMAQDKLRNRIKYLEIEHAVGLQDLSSCL